MTVATDSLGTVVLADIILTFRKQKDVAERAFAQIDDAQFFHCMDAESNSVAVIAKHVGGNLRSRWTNFLTTDGEKPTRDRDSEFVVPGQTTRGDVMAVWNEGWSSLFDTLTALEPRELTATISIRGETMPAVVAMNRAVAHISQHVGQIILLAKHYRSTDWKTLSIPRGRSADYASTPSPSPR